MQVVFDQTFGLARKELQEQAFLSFDPPELFFNKRNRNVFAMLKRVWHTQSVQIGKISIAKSQKMNHV